MEGEEFEEDLEKSRRYVCFLIKAAKVMYLCDAPPVAVPEAAKIELGEYYKMAKDLFKRGAADIDDLVRSNYEPPFLEGFARHLKRLYEKYSARIAAPAQEGVVAAPAQEDVVDLLNLLNEESDRAGEGTSSGTKTFTADEVDELFWKEIGPFVESLKNDSKKALADFKEARKFDSKEGWRGILRREDFFTLLTCYKFLKSGEHEEDLAPPSFFTHQERTKFGDYKKAYLGLDDDKRLI